MRKGTAPTMKDVAQEAGVSLGTVSKVFNSTPVGEEYKRKVLEAAERLGYQVNRYARGLKTNKTYSVAVILPNVTTPFFAVLAQHICNSLAKRDYRMYLSVTDFDPAAEERFISMARQNQVDGIIGLTYDPELRVEPGVPFVSFDRYVGQGVPCVASDNFGGGELAAKKLLELGCTRLLYLRTGSTVPGEPDKRRDGFEAGCRANHTPFETLFLTDMGNGEELQTIREFLETHFSGGKRDFDGIFCCTDALAGHVLQMLKKLDVKVPEEVQMIGFDGTYHYLERPLFCSTVVQPVPLLAEKCVDILLSENKDELPSLICLPVRYLPGGTTKE